MEPLGDGRADVLRQRHAVSHRDALDRDERHDVHGAEPRMFAAMRAQVDVRDRALEEHQHRLLEAGRVADDREHGTIVRRVG